MLHRSAGFLVCVLFVGAACHEVSGLADFGIAGSGQGGATTSTTSQGGSGGEAGAGGVGGADPCDTCSNDELCIDDACRLPRSCAEWHQADPMAGDGPRLLDPDGPGAIEPIELYCDNTTDDGGWTLIHKTDASTADDRTDDGLNTTALQSPTVDTVAILPRATIAALGATYRLVTEPGKRFYWSGVPYYTTDIHASEQAPTTKTDWADPWIPGTVGYYDLHSVCIFAGDTEDSTYRHICTQRFCCGLPDTGFWVNGADWQPGGYEPGTAWVR